MPDWMPAALPDNWTGGFVLLVLVFVISSFLDNIAAALIGATVAQACLQRPRPHRLPRSNRRRVQRRWLGQRHRRHDDHNALDRRRQPASGASCLCRGYLCAVRLGYPGIACTTEIRANRQRSADRSANLVHGTLRGDHCARVGDRGQCRGASPRRPYSGRGPPHRACGRGRHSPDGPIARPDWSIVPQAARGRSFSSLLSPQPR